MTELYYMPTVKINAKTADLVISGNHIRIDDYQYERLRSKPRGRSRVRTLQNMSTDTTIILYS